MKKIKLNQSGAVSMLSVLIFSIIITVITTAYIKSVITQQHNAINYDLGTRAYYAAESGVQDGVRALLANPDYRTNGKSECPPDAGLGELGIPDYGLGYTCQLINVKPVDIKGSVEPWSKTAMIRLGSQAPPSAGLVKYKVKISWSPKTSGSQQIYYPRNREEPLFTAYDKWNVNYNDDKPIHALLRVNIISVPKTGSFTRNEIRQRVIFLNPAKAREVENYAKVSIANDQIKPQQESLFNNAVCYESNDTVNIPTHFGDYSCKRTIHLMDGYDLRSQALYIRIGSLYKSTNFQLTLTDESDTPLQLENNQAVIDVTGRAGNNIFRRVQQSVSLGGYYDDTQPDAALIAGEGICKLMSYATDSTSYKEDCNPLASN